MNDVIGELGKQARRPRDRVTMRPLGVRAAACLDLPFSRSVDQQKQTDGEGLGSRRGAAHLSEPTVDTSSSSSDLTSRGLAHCRCSRGNETVDTQGSSSTGLYLPRNAGEVPIELSQVIFVVNSPTLLTQGLLY